jgi:sugar lactone lactonase YvrE
MSAKEPSVKARAIFFVVAILCLNPALTGAAAAGTASPPNPADRSTDLGAPRSATGRSALIGASASPDAPAVALGQPGTAFRYVRTFGMTEEAYVPDLQHINGPGGLFIDGNDNLYLVEERGARVLKFNAAGQNLLVMGVAGLNIADQERFSTPRSIVTDANGNIWISDNHRVVECDVNGMYVRQIGTEWEWDDQTHFRSPRGLAFDSSGRLYVADEYNHRVQIYQFSGGVPVYSATIGVTGESGADNAHLYNPTQVAFDSSGRLYILDRSNNRVQRCVYAGSWTCTTFFGVTGVWGDDLTHLGSPFGMTIDRNDNIFIVDSGNQRVLKCTLGGVCAPFAGVTGEVGADNAHFNWAGSVAVDSHGTVYVSDYTNHRIQKFSGTGIYISTLGVTGVPYVLDSARLNQPNRVAVGPDGSIYVTEHFGERLVKLNANGLQQWTVGTAGVYGGDNAHFGDYWSGPTGVALDAAGDVYVADTANHRIQIFNSDGAWIGRLGKTRDAGSDATRFDGPVGVAVDGAGNIYVTDTNNGRIQKCVRSGMGGTCMTFEDGLDGPYGIAVDGQGNVFVSEVWGNGPVVQKCSPAGACALFAGIRHEWADDFGHFSGPRSLAVDGQGYVYVADAGNNRVQVFDSAGAYLATIGGTWGSRTGDLRDPSGVAVDLQGNVYIADSTNHRIQKFAPGVPGWRQVNINGFGDRNNWGVLALEVFKGDLYAGTRNPVLGASVWRTADGTIWNQVSEPGFSGAFGNTNSMVWDLAVFGDQLYATAASDNSGRGQLWRTADGSTWSQIVNAGFGDSDDTGVRALAAWGNMFYACTYNRVNGVEIWRSDTGNSGTWLRVVSGGNGNPANYICTGFQEFNGYLYTAVENESTGAQVWRTADGMTWSSVVADGFGDTNNYQTGGLAVFGGYLYVGTRNYATPAQLWRSQDGTHWAPVFKNGLGDNNNFKAEGVGVFQGQLYAFLVNDVSGLEIWRSGDGMTWAQINPDGFGDSSSNYTLWSNGLAVYKGRLNVGTLNWGWGGLGKVWQLLSQTYLPLVLR